MNILYWSLPVLLLIFQLVFTFHSNTQIRYEELSDSVRNVFWLEHHKIYDGVSNGVGWYSTLLLVYNLFGFDLFSAKYLRLVLALISLFGLTHILYKYLGEKKALLSLLVIGTSPTILFLNSTQTEYGLDLQFLPIYLLLITTLDFKLKKLWLNLLQTAILGGLLMMGASAYPTFVYYVPVMLVLLLWKMGGISAKLKYQVLSVLLVSFLLPLILIFAYLEPPSRSLLIFDPVAGSGIFRGAGSLRVDAENFAKNLGGITRDLFVSGSSYHFEAKNGEFSLIFPIISVVFVLWVSFFLAFKHKDYNRCVILALVWGLAVLVLSSLTLDPSGSPGMRRYTPVLASFYTLMVIVYKSGLWKKYVLVAVAALFIHHIIVYPINLTHLRDPSPEQYPLWFKAEETPKESLNLLLKQVQQDDLKLVCQENGKPYYCRYAESYAAVAGSCIWNHLDCHQILGYDFKTGQFIPLSVDLWNEYYFEH